MRVVMSIGNPIKSDDNIGNIVLDKIDVEAIKIRAETAPENFLDKIEDCDIIIILDALEFGGYAGEVRCFDLEEVEDRLLSTHSIPIVLLRKFFDSKILVIGIQPKNLDFGEELSNEMKIEEISKKVEKIIRSL